MTEQSARRGSRRRGLCRLLKLADLFGRRSRIWVLFPRTKLVTRRRADRLPPYADLRALCQFLPARPRARSALPLGLMRAG